VDLECGGLTKIPYKLTELVEAVASERLVYIVEGEAKVDALAEFGVVATCNVGGAGKWEAGLSDYLRNASVVLLPDNDESGFRHIHKVGAFARRYRCAHACSYPAGTQPKGDIKIPWGSG
jgi:DNA primase